MNKKNKILKIFSFVVFAFVLVLSIFTFIPQKHNKIDSSYALDETINYYEFQGSNNISFLAITNWYNNLGFKYFLDVRFDFGTINNSTYFYGKCILYGNSNDNIATDNMTLYHDSYSAINPVTPDNYRSNLITNGQNSIYHFRQGSGQGGVQFCVYTTEHFNSNVYAIELGKRSTSKRLTQISGNNFVCEFFYIRYYSDSVDNVDQYIEFEFFSPRDYEYNTRTYYTRQDLTNNQVYNEGYNAGLSANQDTIYNNGYRAGNIDGYDRGFDAGIVQGGNYTFNGLFSAIIDAPVKVFSGLLNFELLGVNLLGFITGLITLCLIIWIIKISIGGK